LNVSSWYYLNFAVLFDLCLSRLMLGTLWLSLDHTESLCWLLLLLLLRFLLLRLLLLLKASLSFVRRLLMDASCCGFHLDAFVSRKQIKLTK